MADDKMGDLNIVPIERLARMVAMPDRSRLRIPINGDHQSGARSFLGLSIGPEFHKLAYARHESRAV
jgi:hypothetical protein